LPATYSGFSGDGFCRVCFLVCFSSGWSLWLLWARVSPVGVAVSGMFGSPVIVGAVSALWRMAASPLRLIVVLFWAVEQYIGVVKTGC